MSIINFLLSFIVNHETFISFNILLDTKLVFCTHHKYSISWFQLILRKVLHKLLHPHRYESIIISLTISTNMQLLDIRKRFVVERNTPNKYVSVGLDLLTPCFHRKLGYRKSKRNESKHCVISRGWQTRDDIMLLPICLPFQHYNDDKFDDYDTFYRNCLSTNIVIDILARMILVSPTSLHVNVLLAASLFLFTHPCSDIKLKCNELNDWMNGKWATQVKKLLFFYCKLLCFSFTFSSVSLQLIHFHKREGKDWCFV